MNKRKQVLSVLAVCSIMFASFALVYAVAWTPDDMAVYMQNVGRHKIYQTNWILYNEIGPKMGQGLVGESALGLHVASGTTPFTMWSYTPPSNNPKKVTFWIDLGNMSSGDSLTVWVKYNVSNEDIPDKEGIEDTPSRNFSWTFNNEQTYRTKHIVDELSIANRELAIIVQRNSGGAIPVYYQYIIEEM